MYAVRFLPVWGATVSRRAHPHRSRAARQLAGDRRRMKRTAQEGEALGQQRRDFVGMHRDKCACRDGVMATDGPTGKDCEDGQKRTRGKPAATAIGDGGAVTAKTPRMTSIPSHQRATDSHNYTRLEFVEHCSKEVRGMETALIGSTHRRRSMYWALIACCGAT